MKNLLKGGLNTFCIILILPFAVISRIEQKISPSSEAAFSFFAQLLALIPGLPGVFLRRAYYFLTVQRCSLHCHIGFGTILGHRKTIIEHDVSIGNYAVIGTAHIKSGCEIGSRVSITSGKNQHSLTAEGKWSPFDPATAEQIIIHNDVWIGEGAIIMAEVGQRTLIGAGAVVAKPVPKGVVAVGNPASVVRGNNN